MFKFHAAKVIQKIESTKFFRENFILSYKIFMFLYKL